MTTRLKLYKDESTEIATHRLSEVLTSGDRLERDAEILIYRMRHRDVLVNLDQVQQVARKYIRTDEDGKSTFAMPDGGIGAETMTEMVGLFAPFIKDVRGLAVEDESGVITEVNLSEIDDRDERLRLLSDLLWTLTDLMPYVYIWAREKQDEYDSFAVAAKKVSAPDLTSSEVDPNSQTEMPSGSGADSISG